MTPEQQLSAGLKQLELPVDEGLIERCLYYLAMVQRWNRVTNLTAITDLAEMIDKHLLDSLSIHPWLSQGRILDVGSGAGLPGIPLALFNPDKDFILLDASGKKTRFMTQAVIELSLPNVRVEQARVEDFSGSFDQVLARAFTSMAKLVESCSHLIAEGGSLLAMKGPDVFEEIKTVDQDRWQTKIEALPVNAEIGERYLTVVKRKVE